MKIILATILFSHHQKPVSDALYKLTNKNFRFVETYGLTDELRKLGYSENNLPEYVLRTYAGQEEESTEWIASADVVVTGSIPQSMICRRINDNKLVMKYSERPLKCGMEPLKYLPRLLKWHIQNPQRKKLYLLCASAFTAWDYSRFGLFRGRFYKWGYFPPTTRYDDLEKLLSRKNRERILWVGRFLPLKHPDDAIRAAKYLKESGISFQLDFIGTGPMEQALHDMIQECGLGDFVHILGQMPPEKVRKEMEDAGALLFTSDRQEGWGAVINEAMNSGCAVVASDAVGSVPFLIRHGINGLAYRSGDVSDLTEKIKMLLKQAEEQHRMGTEAYRTITETWNAETAAERLLLLSDAIICGDPTPDLFPDGPCSRAQVIKDDWLHPNHN